MSRARRAFSLVAVVAMGATLWGGCSSSDDGGVPDTIGGDGGGADVSGGGGGTICLLSNCDLDRDCADCSGGRHVCAQKEHRCVACGPLANGAACAAGQYCTPYGACAPNGLTCPTDPSGVPTKDCATAADCAACDPKHQACDAGGHKCVGCTASDLTNCQSTDACVNDVCVPKCPATCAGDADCSLCGAPGKEAHACNAHKCAQCSPTVPCPNGGTCDEHGACKPPCGVLLEGRKDACTSDASCAGCEQTEKCDLPVNGGAGTCRVAATGCSDLLGKGILVLPDPYSRFTNLCSTDADCANVQADFDVGGAIRSVTGLSSVKDANVPYPMHACASVTIVGGKSCGVCVPCKVDSDCQDIDVTSVVGQAFGPVGEVATSILLDRAFGPNDHKLHMYCDQLAGNYGVCVPCGNILASCAQGGALPQTGACDHDECAEGGALGPQCDACSGEVCGHDSYCCTDAWDQVCIREVDEYCSLKTCAPPDSCEYKGDGWYCSTVHSFASYRCTSTTTAEGFTCPTDQYCHPSGPGPKATAILGTDGKPQCFATPP